MKKLLVIIVLFGAFGHAYGQWYVREYNASAICFLTGPQLDKALHNSKIGLLGSVVVAGMGSYIIVFSQYGNLVKDDNPSFVAEVLGVKGMRTLITSLGAGLLAGGAAGCIINLDRIIKINKVIEFRSSTTGSLRISPGIMVDNYTGALRPGISLSCTF